uniref:Uncharacterized protein n=1 Tax=mine drainage metagenome TaxID=410659 RepID=E6QBW5_9ZZZZ
MGFFMTVPFGSSDAQQVTQVSCHDTNVQHPSSDMARIHKVMHIFAGIGPKHRDVQNFCHTAPNTGVPVVSPRHIILSDLFFIE